MLYFFIFLAYISCSESFWFSKLKYDKSKCDIAYQRHKLNSRSRDKCEIRIFDEPNCNGDNIGVAKSNNKKIKFNNIQSLVILGPCCWKIYSQRKMWKFRVPGRRIIKR